MQVPEVLNPLTEKALSDSDAAFVTEVRQVRRRARNGTRSGDPAVRAEAHRVVRQAPKLIHAVYRKDAREQAQLEGVSA